MSVSSKLRVVSLACAVIAVGTMAACASVGVGNGDAPTIAASSLGVAVALNPQPLPPIIMDPREEWDDYDL